MISDANRQGGTLGEDLARVDISRRSFMKFCGTMAAILATGTPNVDKAAAQLLTPSVKEIANKPLAVKRPKVAWLQLQKCIECMEPVLCSRGITAEDVVLSLVPVDCNELLMASSGYATEKALGGMDIKDHILVVNGSIPTDENSVYCTIGGRSAERMLLEAVERAAVILAVDVCVVWDSVQAAKPDPTGARGVDEIIKNEPMINVSSCPLTGEMITTTLTYILTYGKTPEVDAEGRPKLACDQRIHDSCLRYAYLDAGQFVRTFNDGGIHNGQCFYEVGREGPSTLNLYPVAQWNPKSGWPIGVGHPCTGCTEKDFFDQFTLPHDRLSGTPSIGVESSVNEVDVGLSTATAAGVAIHDGLTLVKELKIRRSNGEERVLAASGGTEERKPSMADLPPDSSGAQSEAASDPKGN